MSCLGGAYLLSVLTVAEQWHRSRRLQRSRSHRIGLDPKRADSSELCKNFATCYPWRNLGETSGGKNTNKQTKKSPNSTFKSYRGYLTWHGLTHGKTLCAWLPNLSPTHIMSVHRVYAKSVPMCILTHFHTRALASVAFHPLTRRVQPIQVWLCFFNFLYLY